jgi:hypothetical protein
VTSLIRCAFAAESVGLAWPSVDTPDRHRTAALRT